MNIELEAHHLNRTELDDGLAAIKQSPMDDGRLESIVIRPATNERVVLDQCEVSPNGGIHGDRWAKRGQAEDIQVTLMNSRAAALIAKSKERWPLAGDQLYVDLDLSEDNLPPGTQFAIGSAIFEITDQDHTGCTKFSSRFGAEALQFVNSPEGARLNLRGIYAKVIQAGTIRVGDRIHKRA
jgi:MOSC domain-containing protein YiiM